MSAEMASEMIFGQDWSGVDAKNFTERKDPVHGLVTVFHDVVIVREIIQPYELDGKLVRAYKSADEIEQYWKWVDGRWAIAGRHPSTPVIVSPGDIAGRTVKPRFVKSLKDTKTGRPTIRGVLVDLEVFNDRVTPDILKGMKDGSLTDVSIGFLYGKDMTPGSWNGDDYDLRQVNMFHDHTAFGIKKGRCSYPACGIGADTLLGEKRLKEETSTNQVTDMESVINIINSEVDGCEDSRSIALSDKGDISLLVCGDENQISAYVFTKDADWTEEKAQAWVDENKEGAADLLAARLVILEEAKDIKAQVVKHFSLTEESYDALTDEARTTLIAALPETVPVTATDMSEDEVKDKITEIQKQINVFYESKERTEPVDYSEVEPLYAEMNAYKESLAELIKARVASQVGEDKSDKVDEVARSKRLLGDPRLKREAINVHV